MTEDAGPPTPLDEFHLAQARKFNAEAALMEAQGKKERAFAAQAENAVRNGEIEIARNEIKLDHERRHFEIELASGLTHQTYYLADKIDGETVGSAIQVLDVWHRTRPNCEIEIVLSSPGGEMVPGMALFDKLRLLSSQGHRITTRALGLAGSMAGILLQAGDRRVMGAESYLMIHEVSFGAGGKIGQVEDTVKWVTKVQERVLDIFVKRSAGKLTALELKKRWKRADWWIDSDEALALGLVDEVQG